MTPALAHNVPPERQDFPQISTRYTVPAQAMLASWQAAGDIYSRLFSTLEQDVISLADMTEIEIVRLMDGFRELHTLSRKQNEAISSIVSTARNIRLGDEQMALQDFGKFIEDTLTGVIHLTVHYSKQSMLMVYRLGDVIDRLTVIEKLAADVGVINRRTNMLALNAAVEAHRAGEAGATFQVLAHEVRDLARQVETLSAGIADEVATISQGVRDTHKMLVDFAGTDMSPTMLAQERLEKMMMSLINQNESFTQYLEQTSHTYAQTERLGGIITSFQFQDRMKQSLEHVADTFRLVGRQMQQLLKQTDSVVPFTLDSRIAMQEQISAIVDTLDLIPQRAGNLKSLINGKKSAGWSDLVHQNRKANEEYAGEDIELF
jgi:methyl-accepting chemotaxis protein